MRLGLRTELENMNDKELSEVINLINEIARRRALLNNVTEEVEIVED